MVRQDAVFDRTEQRGQRAEGKKGDEQDRHALRQEAQHRQHGDGDFDQFDALAEQRLVIPVRHLAADRRQQEKGQNEDGARERDKRVGRVRRIARAGARADGAPQDKK
jgi:hypothetical protein